MPADIGDIKHENNNKKEAYYIQKATQKKLAPTHNNCIIKG